MRYSVDSKKPIIYIHKDLSRNYALLNLRNLYGVLTVNWLFDAGLSGIPPEMVEKIYDDHAGLSLSQSGEHPLNILYVSVEDTEEAAQLVRIISIMNSITQIPFSIYCSALRHSQVKNYANQHITFIIRSDVSPRSARKTPPLLNYNMVMTYGSGTLHFIRQGIPVMITGAYGFGGTIIPENFPYLLKNGFMGRCGGTYLEIIPSEIVQETLMHIRKNGHSETDLQQIRAMANDLPYKPLSAAGISVQKAQDLYRKLNNTKTRWQLKPKLSSNIEIHHKDGLTYIKRAYINDTLAVADPIHFQFLNTLTGHEDCASLQANTQLSKTDFWDYMYMLWSKKIIIF